MNQPPLITAEARYFARQAPKKAAARITRALESWGRTIRPADPNLKAFILAMREAARCVMCGRQLTDPDSVAAGIGPECNKKKGNEHVQLVLAEAVA